MDEESLVPISINEISVVQVELLIKEEIRREGVNWKKYYFKTVNNANINIDVLTSDTRAIEAMDLFVAKAIEKIKEKRKGGKK